MLVCHFLVTGIKILYLENFGNVGMSMWLFLAGAIFGDVFLWLFVRQWWCCSAFLRDSHRSSKFRIFNLLRLQSRTGKLRKRRVQDDEFVAPTTVGSCSGRRRCTFLIDWTFHSFCVTHRCSLILRFASQQLLRPTERTFHALPSRWLRLLEWMFHACGVVSVSRVVAGAIVLNCPTSVFETSLAHNAVLNVLKNSLLGAFLLKLLPAAHRGTTGTYIRLCLKWFIGSQRRNDYGAP